MAIRSHRDLDVWQLAMQLAHLAYDCTTFFPPIERYVLLPQVRRAALSVPGNIAEGRGREHTGDFLNSYQRRAAQSRSWRHIFCSPTSGTTYRTHSSSARWNSLIM